MKILYQCSTCKAIHNNLKAALTCQYQNSTPQFNTEEKVLYNQGSPYATILRVVEFYVVPYSHEYTYKTKAYLEDNKEIFFKGGLVRECDLTKIEE